MLVRLVTYVIQFFSCCRPQLADDVKVGYFNIDRACQTHQPDVVQLKEMTQVVQGLIKVKI